MDMMKPARRNAPSFWTFILNEDESENENRDKEEGEIREGKQEMISASASSSEEDNNQGRSNNDDNNVEIDLDVEGEEEEDLITRRNLIVNYLPQTFTDVELYNMFSPFGELESVRIMKDTKTGYSFGFGFVNFVREEEAVGARNAMNGFQIATKKIKVSYARPPSDDIKHTNLYITNLPRNMTEEELLKIFRPFGPIIQHKLLKDKYTSLPRGVAFIRYEKRDQASLAIMKLNNTVPPGCSEPVRIRLAEEHGKQKAAYLAGFQAGMVVPRQNEFMSRPSGGGGNSKWKSRSRSGAGTRSRQFSRRKQNLK